MSDTTHGQFTPPSNHAVWWMLGFGVLICGLFAIVYFGAGEKIWIGPEKNFGPPSSNEIYVGPIFVVESEEDAQKIIDVYGVGIDRGLSGDPERDDISITFEKLYYEKQDERHVVCGTISWVPRPYYGYPGRVRRIFTTMDEIQANWDDLLYKYHPTFRYEWSPDVKTEFEKRLEPYRSSR